MEISKEKIQILVNLYGLIHNHPKKSCLKLFCSENNLNYNQWNAHIGGRQVIGLKIVFKLMEIFPDLNMNWLFKNEGNVLVKPVITEETTAWPVSNLCQKA